MRTDSNNNKGNKIQRKHIEYFVYFHRNVQVLLHLA